VTDLTSKKEPQEEEKKEEEEEKEEAEHHPLRALIYPFEVIVSPFKAFKEIAQNPEFKGFALVILLIIAVSIGVQYAYASKILVSVSDREPVAPTLDASQGSYVYVTTFGTYTFKSSEPYIMNYTFIDKTPLTEFSVFWVNTTETLTPVNPLVSTNTNDTFYQITTDLNQSTTKVGNLTLTAKFYSDVKPEFSVLLNKTADWDLGNFTINWFIRSPFTYLANRTTTIDLASKATLSLLQTNVTSAELGSTSSINDWWFSILSDWSDYGNATIYGGNHTLLTYSSTWLDVVFGANDPKIDLTTVGLTYSVFVSAYFFGDYLLFSVMQTALTLFLSWIIYASALLLVSRVFDGQGKPWRPFFIIVGYAFSFVIVRAAVSAVLISTLPQVNFQVAIWPPSQAEATLASEKMNATWGDTMAFQTGTYFNLLVEIWFTMLGAVAVHASRKITWGRAAMFSVIAYFLYFFLKLFMGFW